MKHLTDRADGQKALSVSVPPRIAQDVADAIEHGMNERNTSKNEFVRDCILSGVLEPVAQKRIKLALKIIDDDLNDPETILDYIEPTLAVVRMALLGCPTRANTEFTGELSSEYKERYGDE